MTCFGYIILVSFATVKKSKGSWSLVTNFFNIEIISVDEKGLFYQNRNMTFGHREGKPCMLFTIMWLQKNRVSFRLKNPNVFMKIDDSWKKEISENGSFFKVDNTDRLNLLHGVFSRPLAWLVVTMETVGQTNHV